MVTEKPLACRSFAREAEIIPFPSEEATPPVTKTYLVEAIFLSFIIKSLKSENNFGKGIKSSNFAKKNKPD
jgi:hypothetical protein